MNRRSLLCAALPLVTLPVLNGCFEQVPSAEVSTDAMYASAELTSRDGVSTDIQVELTVGGPLGTNVDVQNGDQLNASAMGQTVTLVKESEMFGGAHYVGTIAHAAENVAFSLDYLRGDASTHAQGCGRTNAVGSFAVMTKPFEIAPMLTSVRFASPVTIAWSNRDNDPMHVAVSGACIVGGSDEVSDTGAFAVETSWLAQRNPKLPSSCSVTAVVTRCRAGQVSPAFGEGGQVKACQERSLSFRVSP